MYSEYCFASTARLDAPYEAVHVPYVTGYLHVLRPPATLAMETCVALPSTLKTSQ
jgi:hypothetical protein